MAGVAGTGDPGGVPAAAGFRLADGSAGCAYADGSIACSAGGESVVLEADGSSHGGDAREVGWDASTPVLLPGESWWNGEFSCRAVDTGLTCSAGDGELHLGPAGAAGATSSAATLEA